jgi:hypothetical protein
VRGDKASAAQARDVDPQMLLDPLEEQLDLPSALVEAQTVVAGKPN